jgi:hypothetical protein
MIGAIGGALAGGGLGKIVGGLGKMLGGLFGGKKKGKCRKKKGQLQQQVGMLKQIVGQLRQQLAHAKGVNQGMQMGFNAARGGGGFPNMGMPPGMLGGASVAMSYSMHARF